MIDMLWVLLLWVCIFSWSFINFMSKEAADVDTNTFPTPSFALKLSHTYILPVHTQPQRCAGDREASALRKLQVVPVFVPVCMPRVRESSRRCQNRKRGRREVVFSPSSSLLPLSVYPVCSSPLKLVL